MSDIIGISAYYHDSSVSLIRDGKIAAFLKEESLTRVKGISSFPKESLRFLMKNYGVSEKTIESVCFYEKPLRGWLNLLSHSLDKPRERWRQTSSLLKRFWDGPVFFGQEIKKLLPISNNQIIYCDHHLSHALTGLLFTGRMDNATIIVLDGVGDGETSSIYKAKNGKIDRIWSQYFPHSLGLFYSTFTDYLGYHVNDGEYKVMALAAYGEPIYSDFILNNIIDFNDGKLSLNLKYFDFHKNPEQSYSSHLIDQFGESASTYYEPYSVNHEEFERFSNIAASAQAVTEIIIEKIVMYAIKHTGCDNIVISGGVAQNSVAITKLLKIEEINKLIVPPSPGDSGAALGAAVYAYLVNGRTNLPNPNLYPGPVVTQPNVMDSIFHLKSNTNNMFDDAAKLLKKGEIIATFIGNGEIGPRALGHRSLICNAADHTIVTKLNSNIKKRETYRPLAPIIKFDTAYQFFDLNPKNPELYSWMACTAQAFDITRTKFNGIVHIDGSARLQIVNKNQVVLWKFLSICEKLDMPILVNTSFNIAGDPIVFDYIDCYVNMTRMDLYWLLTDNGLYERLNVKD